MSDVVHILCPEYVPLENKGEEAIIRGTVDVVFPNRQCEYHIVDMNIDEYFYQDGLHVHPGKLFFSDWRSREFGLGPSWEQWYSSACSLTRNALNKLVPNWVSKPHRQAADLKKYLTGDKNPPARFAKSVELLKKVDYVIAGHNGGLDEYVCHILIELDSIGLPFGIFGTSMKPKVKEKKLLEIYEKAFAISAFNIARNPVGLEWAQKNFPALPFKLNPDPAFGMIPESQERVDEIIEKHDLKSFFEKPVVMFTTAEPAPIARHSFEKSVGPAQKVNAHREFLGQLLKQVVENSNVNVLFLPHTIGPDKKMDDRLISKDAIKRAGLENSDRVKLLTADLSAKDLKGLISNAEFLIAERVHSIIGAIGVNTPFLCLGSIHDTRVRGILKMQMGLGDLIYYLANPDATEAFKVFDEAYTNRVAGVDRLKTLNNRIHAELEPTGRELRGIIEEALKAKN